MNNVVLLPLLVLFFTSCVKESDPTKFEPRFVVEGVIEEGDFPIVKLTHNIPKGYVIDREQLEELIVRWATVKVSTADETEILTLVRDDAIFPYFFYMGKELKGKAGRHYDLEIIYNDVVLRSQTEIPAYKPQVEDVNFIAQMGGQIQPTISIANLRAEANYRVYTKVDSQRNFYSSSPAGFRARDKPVGVYTLALLKGRSLLDTLSDHSTYYKEGDRVDIKVSNITDVSYALWSNFTQQGIQFSFLNYSSNFMGNIQGDAVGIWYGANSTIKRKESH